LKNKLQYPIKFTPILKKKVWGGTKLKQLFNKEAEGNIGESWEISGVLGAISLVENGSLKGKTITALIEAFKEKFLGKKVFATYGSEFPLLFKFIDASKDLSVQLHPDDTLAKERHNSFGKTEMWYIMEAVKNAKLVIGFNERMNEALYKKHLSENRILEILHLEKVKKGDSYFIKPGTVHAIGAGIVLAEIQQTSDITYRIYDYNRPDEDGNLRELHTDLALKAIDFNESKAKLTIDIKDDEVAHVCNSPYFQTNKIVLTKNFNRDLSAIDSFVVYMCVEGIGEISVDGFSEIIKKGETVLIPALVTSIDIKTSSATFLEVYIP